MSRKDARSLWLCQNFYDDIQFSGHTVTASSSPTGTEAYRVGTARRAAIDAWAPSAQNSTHWVQVDCGVPRPANMAVVDRGNNLAESAGGFVLEGRSSTDFGWTPVWQSTATPTVYGPGPSTVAWGVLTYEGALVREFAPQVFRYWRLRTPPSTGYAPVIRNLWLGLAFKPTEPALSPGDWDATQVNYEQAATPSNWRGIGRVALTREGSAMYRLTSFGEYLTARRHVSEYEQAVATWFVPRASRAEEAFCVQIPPVRMPKPQEPGMLFRTLNFPYREYQPAPL